MTDITELPASHRAHRAPLLWLVLALWFAGIVALARNGGFVLEATPLPILVLPAVALPVFGFWLAYRMLPGLQRWVAALDLAWLTGTQAWRVLGIVFVFLWAQGQAPTVFALVAGLGDIAVGVCAVAVSCGGGAPGRRLATGIRGADRRRSGRLHRGLRAGHPVFAGAAARRPGFADGADACLSDGPDPGVRSALFHPPAPAGLAAAGYGGARRIGCRSALPAGHGLPAGAALPRLRPRRLTAAPGITGSRAGSRLRRH